MTFDSTTLSADVADVTGTTPVQTVAPMPTDFPRVVAVLARMTNTGFIQLAKAQARVYVANLRACEGDTHAVFTTPEAESIMTLLDFDRDDKGNNALLIRYTLCYGTSDNKTVKRLRDAVTSGTSADVPTALAQGRGKPPKPAGTATAAGFLIRGNGERVALTDVQYAACLLILK